MRESSEQLAENMKVIGEQDRAVIAAIEEAEKGKQRGAGNKRGHGKACRRLYNGVRKGLKRGNGAYRNRTGHLLIANQSLYQMS